MDTVVTTSSPAAPANSSVASAWHTAMVLAVVLGLSWIGSHTSLGGVSSAHGGAPVYLLTITIEWLWAGLIWWGLRRRGLRISDLVAGSWSRPMDFLRDLGIGIAFVLIFGGAVLQGLAYLLKAAPPTAMKAMMPRTRWELMVWVLMSLTAGFCEELIFRGYLQRQFAAFAHSVAGGIVLQGIAFGLGHGYQGWRLRTIIAVYGIAFGCLAQWRRSLRPGMLAHALQDTVGGFLARYTMH